MQFTHFVFLNFEFFYFQIQYSDIGLLWSKITIFMIGIALKQHLHAKYGWNNPNWGRLGLKNLELYLLTFLSARKFIAHTTIRLHVMGSNLILNWFFFWNACTMSSITINSNWHYQKTANYDGMIPLNRSNNAKINESLLNILCSSLVKMVSDWENNFM